ncbi:hypothetical protein NC653_037392 [Populus alba x Populus x berolinensis]|uniref:Uncharacterized protein n=1 Tax=Populus alba x Populus x berolinensis TaxID=444605 RepID=A0AAD6LEW1_9ROSI|nr:hypothetical protein NC653_037392 [Populus alba x Populus x berolinensis]
MEGRQGFSGLHILDRVWTYGREFPEWTSNVSYYRQNEYPCLSDAISCGVRGIIAFPVFEFDLPEYCCAVLQLVTMEEKQDFDLEKEKVSQALQSLAKKACEEKYGIASKLLKFASIHMCT